MEQKFKFSIDAWSAWSPSTPDKGDWEAWSRRTDTRPTIDCSADQHVKPNVEMIPPLLRRRCSSLARAALSVGLATAQTSRSPHLPIVFASQFGESRITHLLLNQIAQLEALSPMNFGLSVHNSAAGLFSLATKNKSPSVSIAADRESFLFGFWEAISRLEEMQTNESHSEAPTSLLFVMADEVVPEPLSNATCDPLPYYSSSFLLRADDGSEPELPQSLSLRIGEKIKTPDAMLVGERETAETPQAIWFIHWLLSDQRILCFESRGQFWTFSKDQLDFSWSSNFVETNDSQAA